MVPDGSHVVKRGSFCIKKVATGQPKPFLPKGKKVLYRQIKLFSSFENIFSCLDNLFSNLDYIFSSLENCFFP